MSDNSTIDQPMVPPEGDADPRAALVPATATSVTVTHVKKLADLTSAELDAYIKDRASRCQRHVNGFARRVSELYLALFEMEARFNKQQGARTDLKELTAHTWTEYVQGSGASYDAYRQWKSRMNLATKQLGTVVEPNDRNNGMSGGRNNTKSAAVTQAAKNLADAKAQLGKSAEDGSEQAKAIIADYEKAHADAVAANNSVVVTASSTLIKQDTSLSPSVSNEALSFESEPEPASPSPAPASSTSTPVVTKDEQNRGQLIFLIKRLKSMGEALKQVVDSKANWSKYEEYAEVISEGQNIARLVKALKG